MKRKYDSGICFLCICYSENETKRNLIGNALLRHEDVVWTNHDGEEGNKDHTHVVIRVTNAQTISAFAKNHEFPENLIQLCGRDREHKNAKGAIIYISHQDEESILSGKKQYDETYYLGPWATYAKNVLRSYLAKRRRNDSDITLILDFIDRQEYVDTATLVRWCCSHNLYSVYRRSASIVNSCIREHNTLCRYSDPESVVLSRLRDISQRQDRAEKAIAYLKGVDSRRERAESQAKVDMSIITEMLTRRGFND